MTRIVKSYISAENIAEHMPVTLNQDGQVKKIDAAGEIPLGVTDKIVASGKVVDVVLQGESYVQVGVACNALQFLTVDTSTGKAKPLDIESATNTAAKVIYTVGQVLEGDSSPAYLRANINIGSLILPAQA